ncbi:MAG: HAD family hydrolase [Dehalococcoidia bacterium]|jgi:putative hydrolase of the HAD superfamily
MAVRAVLFDLGDTLWHFPNMPPVEIIRGETVHRISDLLRSWGVEPAGELFFLGRDIRAAIEKATDEAYWGDLVSPNYPALAKQVAAEKGLPISDEQAVQLWHTWNLGGIFLGRALYPDVFQTLQLLKGQGYRLGSVTNRALGGEPFRDELRHHGVVDFFEVLSISCEVGYLKPHRRIFEYALDTLGVRAEEAMMVGDSLRADVEGAKALGMCAVLKRSSRSAAEEAVDKDMGTPEDGGTAEGKEGAAPDFVIDHLPELTALPILKRA